MTNAAGARPMWPNGNALPARRSGCHAKPASVRRVMALAIGRVPPHSAASRIGLPATISLAMPSALR